MKAIPVAAAVLLTVALFIQTRYYGPNREYTVENRCGDLVASHTAPRSHKGEGEAVLKVTVGPPGQSIAAFPLELQGKPAEEDAKEAEWIYYPIQKRDKGSDNSPVLSFTIPSHPLATQFQYRFVIRGENEKPQIILSQNDDKPMILKFVGNVPIWVLVPHIICMFLGITFLFLALFGAVALVRNRSDAGGTARLARWAWTFMFAGGVPFGIAMNWYAFHVLWEAVPFGDDITDNKTQVALVFWGLASIVLTRRPGRHSGLFALAAGLLVVAMYLIPHSL